MNKNNIENTISINHTYHRLEVTKELSDTNPWQVVADKMNGHLFYQNEQLVCEKDVEIIDKYNTKVGVNSDYAFQLGVPPYPFVGDVLNAKIIILSLNPGYVEQMNKDLALLFKDDVAQELDTMQKEAMLLKGKGIYEMGNKADRILGDHYWKKMFSQISKLYPDNKKSQIYNDIAIVQMYGYNSTKFKTSKLLETLQSFKYTKEVLSYLYKHSDCLFLTMRHNEEWKAIFKEIIKDPEQRKQRFISNKTHMGNQHLSKNVLKENYKSVLSALGLVTNEKSDS